MKVSRSSNDRGRNKLTDDQAKEIRQKFITTEFTQRQLAEEYGVSQSCINQVVNGRTFRASLIDEDGWPIHNKSEQIRILKSQNTKLQKQVDELQKQVDEYGDIIAHQQGRIEKLEARVTELEKEKE